MQNKNASQNNCCAILVPVWEYQTVNNWSGFMEVGGQFMIKDVRGTVHCWLSWH